MAGDSRRSAVFYHPEIDVLRFGAFFLVWLSHAMPIRSEAWQHLGFPGPVASAAAGLMRGGAYGVDLFFALSSYLITEILLREYRFRKSIDVRAFYFRRILRIWPVYFLALFAGPPLARALGDPDTLRGGHLVAFAFFVGNWDSALFGWQASTFTILWSVSIEEQFYLVWPLIMSRFIRHLRPIAYGLIACAFLTRLYLLEVGAQSPAFWCNTLARLDPIAAGALLASCLDGRTPILGRGMRIAMVAAAVAIITLAGQFGDYNGLPTLIGFPMAAVASILLIAAALVPEGTLQPGAFGGMFVYLGRISYGLYVYHEAAIKLTIVPSSSTLSWILNIVGSLGVTVLAAALSYRFIESPFLRLKKRYSWVESSPVAQAA